MVDPTREAVGGGGERRGAPRVAVRLEAAYEDADRQVFLATRDVSESGVFLAGPEPPGVGVPARIALELPGQPAILRVAGTVVRIEPEVGFALQFDPARVDAALRALLREFVASHQRM